MELIGLLLYLLPWPISLNEDKMQLGEVDFVPGASTWRSWPNLLVLLSGERGRNIRVASYYMEHDVVHKTGR